jgi:hypothetical protein
MNFILEHNQDVITLSIPGGFPVNDNQARAFPDQTIQMTRVVQFMTDHSLRQTQHIRMQGLKMGQERHHHLTDLDFLMGVRLNA